MKIIGLMSGTSVDGIDVALTEVLGEGYAISAELIEGVTYPYSDDVRSQILSICANEPITLAALAKLDDAIAHHFLAAIQALKTDLAGVELIGSHGQTLYHRPPENNRLGYTIQLGRGELIARATGCPTVSNFRPADIALGGQGAPLVPIVDACLLSQPQHALAVQNIGGIGNVTYLPPWDKQGLPPADIIGWDTGPGNALIDWAVTQLSMTQQAMEQKTYDVDGEWAAQGTPYQPLIDRWLQQPFFKTAPPKSTGRELFGADYAARCWQDAQHYQLSEADFIATLTDFTAATIELSYRQFLTSIPAEILVGGGGGRNLYLMQRLRQRLPSAKVNTTNEHQLDSDYKEAIAFAVLAYWHWHKVPGNLTSVTGADRPCLLGQLWRP